MSKLFRIVLPIALLSLLLTVSGFAQQQTGELLVKASDPSGAVISGAKVVLNSTALIQPIEGKTDATGVFPARGLKSGTYKVTVSQTGFRTVSMDKVVVEVGHTYAVDAVLTVGAISETVEVSATGLRIDTVKSENAEVLNTDKLLSTPGTRDFADYVKLLPSVNNESFLSGISVDGASGAENVFYVDGIDTSNMYGGTNNQTVRPEIVQELQVKTGGYEAEFGGAMGGVVSVVTKSGSNDWHGQLYYYYSGSSLNGGSRPVLRLNPDNEKIAEYLPGNPKDHNNRNELGASLGGPIFKNKAWFFINVNPTWSNFARDTRTLNNDGSLSPITRFTQQQFRRSGLAKLDIQPWQRIRFYAAYVQDTYKQKGTLPSYNETGNTDFTWGQDGYKQPSYTFNGGVTATITPKILVDTKYGFNGLNDKPFLGPTGPTWLFRSSNSAIGFCNGTTVACAGTATPSPLYKPSGYFNQDPNSTAYQTTEDFMKKLSYSSVASLTFGAGGQHNLKGGVEWSRWVWDNVDAHPFDYLRLNFGRAYTGLDGLDHTSTCTGPDGLPHTPCGYIEVRSPFGTVAKVHTDHTAFFFQDGWTIGRRLTINPGIRFEKEQIPSFSSLPQYQGAAFKWGFGDKVAPRFGASYDLKGNGKVKVYGSWGWFYDNMKLGMAQGSFGGFKWHSQYYLMNQAFVTNWANAGGAHDPAGFSAGCSGSLAGGAVNCASATNMLGMTFVDDRDWRIPSFDSLDPNLHAMRMHNITLGSDIELMKNYIFSFTFVQKRLDYAIEDTGVQTALGESYYITNPGFGYSVSKFVAAGMPPTAKAKRNYDAWIFRLRKPMSRNWTGDLSYTYSRLRGNYSGLATSDEEGRNDPNVSRAFDLWYLNYDASGHHIDGPLNTDRPSQLKFNGQYQLPHNLPAIGGFFQALSGTPVTSQLLVNNAEMYVNNRADKGRTPFFTQTDMYLIQKFKPFKDEAKSVEFNVNIVNLFNQSTATHIYRYMNRTTVNLPAGVASGTNLTNVNAFLANGFDWQTALNAVDLSSGGLEKDPRFLMKDGFQGPINIRFGVRFNF